jgi:hypothetical protein
MVVQALSPPRPFSGFFVHYDHQLELQRAADAVVLGPRFRQLQSMLGGTVQ